jgi:DNA-binding transcriptional regulator YdaS (Cro superfamily)
MSGIDKLLEKAANLSEAARVCGITPQAAYQWKRKKRIPQEHVRALCKKYGFSPHELRPDLFEVGWTFGKKK